jgi:hypothetical protein
MERKLGIDWEHEPDEEQDLRMSLQTNEEVDKAFPELRSTFIEDSLPNVSGLSGSNPKSGSGPQKLLGSVASKD